MKIFRVTHCLLIVHVYYDTLTWLSETAVLLHYPKTLESSCFIFQLGVIIY